MVFFVVSDGFFFRMLFGSIFYCCCYVVVVVFALLYRYMLPRFVVAVVVLCFWSLGLWFSSFFADDLLEIEELSTDDFDSSNLRSSASRSFFPEQWQIQLFSKYVCLLSVMNRQTSECWLLIDFCFPFPFLLRLFQSFLLSFFLFVFITSISFVFCLPSLVRAKLSPSQETFGFDVFVPLSQFVFLARRRDMISFFFCVFVFLLSVFCCLKELLLPSRAVRGLWLCLCRTSHFPADGLFFEDDLFFARVMLTSDPSSYLFCFSFFFVRSSLFLLPRFFSEIYISIER